MEMDAYFDPASPNDGVATGRTGGGAENGTGSGGQETSDYPV